MCASVKHKAHSPHSHFSAPPPLSLYPMTHSHFHVPKSLSRSLAPASAPPHSLSLSVLFLINSYYSHLLMFILPTLSVFLKAFYSLQALLLSTQGDSKCNIKAIHNNAGCSVFNIQPHTSVLPLSSHNFCPYRSLCSLKCNRNEFSASKVMFSVHTHACTITFKTESSFCIITFTIFHIS